MRIFLLAPLLLLLALPLPAEPADAGKSMTDLMGQLVEAFASDTDQVDAACQNVDRQILAVHGWVDRRGTAAEVMPTARELDAQLAGSRALGRKHGNTYLRLLQVKMAVLAKNRETQDELRTSFNALSTSFVRAQRLLAEMETNVALLRKRLKGVGLDALAPPRVKLKVHVPSVRPLKGGDESNTVAKLPEGDLIFLVLGTDTLLYRGRSDVVFLVRISADEGAVRVLSIPRDTLVELPVHDQLVEDKLNHAYARDGIAGTLDAVRRLLELDVRNHVLVDYHLFQYVVDSIGGVPLDVEKELRYEDRAGGLKIAISRGKQVLDGENALGYVRFRHDGRGDLGRIERQHKFLRAFLKQAKSPRRQLLLLSALPGLSRYLSFDVPLIKAAWFAIGKLKTLKLPQVQMKTLPGESAVMPSALYGGQKLWYYVPNREKIRNMVLHWFLGLPEIERAGAPEGEAPLLIAPEHM